MDAASFFVAIMKAFRRGEKAPPIADATKGKPVPVENKSESTNRRQKQHVPQYSRAMQFARITPEVVEKIRAALERPTYSVFIPRISVGLTSDNSFFGTQDVSFSEFAELMATRQQEIQSLCVYYAHAYLKGSAPITNVFWKIDQKRFPAYGGEIAPTLEVGAMGCDPQSFEYFATAVQIVLGVQPIAGHGLSLNDTEVRERFQQRWVDRDLYKHTLGAIGDRQYDVAIKAAIGIVESRLREKCISAGCADAKHKSGSDLAEAAYGKSAGCLVPPWPIASEATDGAHLLFRGFFMYLRNAFAHHAVVVGSDTSGVYDILALCEFLLMVIDNSQRRL